MGEDFVNWLNQRMQAANLNQSELARKAGLNSAAISRLLAGKAIPTSETLTALARVFGVPPEQLFRLAGKLPPDVDADPWVEEKAYKLSKLDPELREIADDFIDGLVRRQERNKRRTKPARP